MYVSCVECVCILPPGSILCTSSGEAFLEEKKKVGGGGGERILLFIGAYWTPVNQHHVSEFAWREFITDDKEMTRFPRCSVSASPPLISCFLSPGPGERYDAGM